MVKQSPKLKPAFKPPQKRNSTVVSLSLPDPMFERLQHEAQRLNTTQSEYMRRALEYVWSNAPEYAEVTAQ